MKSKCEITVKLYASSLRIRIYHDSSEMLIHTLDDLKRTRKRALYIEMTEKGYRLKPNLPPFSLPALRLSPFLSPRFPPSLHRLDKCVTTGTRCTFVKLSAFHRPRYKRERKRRAVSHVHRTPAFARRDIDRLFFSLTFAKLMFL